MSTKITIGDQLIAKAKELDSSYNPDNRDDMSEALNIILSHMSAPTYNSIPNIIENTQTLGSVPVYVSKNDEDAILEGYMSATSVATLFSGNPPMFIKWGEDLYDLHYFNPNSQNQPEYGKMCSTGFDYSIDTVVFEDLQISYQPDENKVSINWYKVN